MATQLTKEAKEFLLGLSIEERRQVCHYILHPIAGKSVPAGILARAPMHIIIQVVTYFFNDGTVSLDSLISDESICPPPALASNSILEEIGIHNDTVKNHLETSGSSEELTAEELAAALGEFYKNDFDPYEKKKPSTISAAIPEPTGYYPVEFRRRYLAVQSDTSNLSGIPYADIRCCGFEIISDEDVYVHYETGTGCELKNTAFLSLVPQLNPSSMFTINCLLGDNKLLSNMSRIEWASNQIQHLLLIGSPPYDFTMAILKNSLGSLTFLPDTICFLTFGPFCSWLPKTLQYLTVNVSHLHFICPDNIWKGLRKYCNENGTRFKQLVLYGECIPRHYDCSLLRDNNGDIKFFSLMAPFMANESYLAVLLETGENPEDIATLETAGFRLLHRNAQGPCGLYCLYFKEINKKAFAVGFVQK